MKKLILSLVIGISLIGFSTKNASAIVSLALANAPLAVAGASVTAVGAALITTGVFVMSDDDSTGSLIALFTLVVPGAIVAALGIVILDEGNGINLNFKELNIVASNKLKLSHEELESFNYEIDEINAIKESIQNELWEMENPSLELAGKLWTDYSEELTPAAFRAVQKVSKSFYLSNVKI